MRKVFIVSVLALVAALLYPSAAMAAQPKWDMTGTYVINYVGYSHTDVITVTSMSDPEIFGGSGYWMGTGTPSDETNYPETISAGTLTGDNLNFTLTYLWTSYTIDAVGTIGPDGSLSGTADNGTLTWSATSGKARPFGYTTAADCTGPVGTYTGYTYVGTQFVSSLTLAPVGMPTIPGTKYMVEASGTYYANGADAYDIRADAKFSEDRSQFASGAVWTDSVNGYGQYGPQLLDLMVGGNEQNNWGTYNSDHVYTLTRVAADTEMEFQLFINDYVAPGNNAGGLCVSLFRGYTFAGFFSPVDNPEVLNTAKAGQTIPIKWQLSDANGFVSDLSIIHLKVIAPVACSDIPPTDATDAIESYATGQTVLRYDFTANQYVFNLQTLKTWAGSCGKVTLTYGDGTSHDALFRFK